MAEAKDRKWPPEGSRPDAGFIASTVLDDLREFEPTPYGKPTTVVSAEHGRWVRVSEKVLAGTTHFQPDERMALFGCLPSQTLLPHHALTSSDEALTRIAFPPSEVPFVVEIPRRVMQNTGDFVMRCLQQLLSSAVVETNPQIIGDAIRFLGKVPRDLPKPTLHISEDEAAFEWREGDLGAIASVEGDGVVGYAYREEGLFVPGAQEMALRDEEFPEDLKNYLKRIQTAD